ncbi:MAG: tRNA (adenosine(37)-N6)-threonylcarbamoyltransferase complex ATPase subunit type 1 TsaE [Pseudomonadales bacterium]|nr:tRNA (adenosine(37)-N6)-threonylcarbamoyltransferase complex ATPase subunit type 1 TsaE [Pseudomonadales bacterium]
MLINIIAVDEAATLLVAEKTASAIDAVFGRNALVFLDGQLGAGKTTFCRGMMRWYGYLGAVKSPTFTIVEPYELVGGQVYHFDLYRLNDPEELEYLGMDDYLNCEALSLIEWSERGLEFLPPSDLRIHLKPVGTGRNISLQADSGRGADVCQRVASDMANG